MFSDEDLFTISITADRETEAGRNLKRGQNQSTQTDPLETEEKETTTLKATISVEVQADSTDGQQNVQLTDEQYNVEELEGFLRLRLKYITNSLKEYSILQTSKSKWPSP